MGVHVSCAATEVQREVTRRSAERAETGLTTMQHCNRSVFENGHSCG
jgi:hypothetical protein